MPLLGTEVAADFLARRTSDPDRQAATELATELGGLPLALEQAAAYTQADGDTLAGYLALFQHRRAELLARGQLAGYDKTVASTWALAFDGLQTAPGAVGLLRLLAFLAPEKVPLRLLLQPRPGLAGRLSEEVAPVLVPLLDDRLAADDALRPLYPVFAGHPGRRRVGNGAPASAGGAPPAGCPVSCMMRGGRTPRR